MLDGEQEDEVARRVMGAPLGEDANDSFIWEVWN